MKDPAIHQNEILKRLLKTPDGLTLDELASSVKVSRPTVRRYVVAMQRLGYVAPGESIATAGRPSLSYRLTEKGHQLFPKQYAMFTGALLRSLSAQLGSAGLAKMMESLGAEVAAEAGLPDDDSSLSERVRRSAELMNQLAYDAEAKFTGRELPGSPPVIEARNCVYHALATQHPEVCQFDVALLRALTGSEVVHEACVIRGGGCCRFRFTGSRA